GVVGLQIPPNSPALTLDPIHPVDFIPSARLTCSIPFILGPHSRHFLRLIAPSSASPRLRLHQPSSCSLPLQARPSSLSSASIVRVHLCRSISSTRTSFALALILRLRLGLYLPPQPRPEPKPSQPPPHPAAIFPTIFATGFAPSCICSKHLCPVVARSVSRSLHLSRHLVRPSIHLLLSPSNPGPICPLLIPTRAHLPSLRHLLVTRRRCRRHARSPSDSVARIPGGVRLAAAAPAATPIILGSSPWQAVGSAEAARQARRFHSLHEGVKAKAAALQDAVVETLLETVVETVIETGVGVHSRNQQLGQAQQALGLQRKEDRRREAGQHQPVQLAAVRAVQRRDGRCSSVAAVVNVVPAGAPARPWRPGSAAPRHPLEPASSPCSLGLGAVAAAWASSGPGHADLLGLGQLLSERPGFALRGSPLAAAHDPGLDRPRHRSLQLPEPVVVGLLDPVGSQHDPQPRQPPILQLLRDGAQRQVALYPARSRRQLPRRL
ncbi:uncharacterized protein BJ171DRAFT_89977, partial [Polychytrium aggregatum]|uniref:uncharacterized protein n=1 Tax=Polychytrium aggregatum TaxID=110093 RepID=UPI0022FF39F6